MRMVDIHSHILPGLDDGAASEKQALCMLKAASRQGIRDIIATPHYSEVFRNDHPNTIRRKCMEIERLAKSHGIPVHIYSGQEIMYTEDVPDLLSEGRLLTLADSRYVLLEFYPGAPRSLIVRAVRETAGRGFLPVLAHAERYSALSEPEKIRDLTEQGACIQMNYRPAGGKWYESATRWCRKLLKSGSVHFMSTDMHNTGARRPETAEALRWMQSHLDGRYVERLIRRNAEKILKNERMNHR